MTQEDTLVCLDIARQALRLAAAIECEISSRVDEQPMTPEQFRKRQERDRDRQQKMRDIQSTASRRVAEIKQKLGK